MGDPGLPGPQESHTFGTLFYVVFPFLISNISLIKYSSKYGKKEKLNLTLYFTRMEQYSNRYSDEKYPPFPEYFSGFSLIFGHFFR